MFRWWVIAVLVLVAGGVAPIRAADDPERQRLVALFDKLEEALLTINSEILQYSERITDISMRLHDRALWQSAEVDQQRLLPRVRELNRVKAALALIGTGLDQRYTQVRQFQPELRERYPALRADIDAWYSTFDRVYESSRERHRKTTAQMDDLKKWLKLQLAARANPDDDDDPPRVAARPRASLPTSQYR